MPGPRFVRSEHAVRHASCVRHVPRGRPIVSIVVPCYNASATLPETLSSVTRQTHLNWEVVAVDDGSTDATPDLLRQAAQADARIRPLRVPHAGLATTRNRGLAAARAEQVLLLDADDLLRPDALAVLLSTSARLGGRSLVSGHCEALDANGDSLRAPRFMMNGDFSFARMLIGNPAPPLIMLPKATVGPDPFDTSVPGCEDWDLWLRLAYQGVPRFQIPRVLFGYRWTRGSMSGKTDLMYYSGKRTLERWLPLCPTRDAARNALHRWAWVCGAAAVAGGDGQALHRYWAPLPPLEPEEEFWRAVAASLDGEYARAHGAYGRTWPEHGSEWLAEIQDWLPTTPAAPWAECILDHLRHQANHDGRPPDFAAPLCEFLAVRSDVAQIVVYGCGRNGRQLLEQLRQLPAFPLNKLRVADDLADDMTLAFEGFQRTDPRTWTTWPAGTIVAVTPNACPAMLETLRRAGGRAGIDFIHVPQHLAARAVRVATASGSLSPSLLAT